MAQDDSIRPFVNEYLPRQGMKGCHALLLPSWDVWRLGCMECGVWRGVVWRSVAMKYVDTWYIDEVVLFASMV
jgi:hypothetical protein